MMLVLSPVPWGGHVRTCRKCGCTEANCSGCVERTGRPCHWVEADLCSACRLPLPVRVLALSIQMMGITPGSWLAANGPDTCEIHAVQWEDGVQVKQLVATDLLPQDARAIALMRDVVTELIAENELMRAELAELRSREAALRREVTYV